MRDGEATNESYLEDEVRSLRKSIRDLRDDLHNKDLEIAALNLLTEKTNEALEEAAEVAESLPDQRGNSPEHLVGMRIARLIRALKTKETPNADK
jgi:hypothetical protein